MQLGVHDDGNDSETNSVFNEGLERKRTKEERSWRVGNKKNGKIKDNLKEYLKKT